MQRLKNRQKPQNKTNFEKSKQIKPKQYNQTKNHQQQKEKLSNSSCSHTNKIGEIIR